MMMMMMMMSPSRSGPAWIIFRPGVLEGDLEGVTVFERLEDLQKIVMSRRSSRVSKSGGAGIHVPAKLSVVCEKLWLFNAKLQKYTVSNGFLLFLKNKNKTFSLLMISWHIFWRTSFLTGYLSP